jgi:alpha-glucuronidase
MIVKNIKFVLGILLCFFIHNACFSNNGYNLWLDHKALDSKTIKKNYSFIKDLVVSKEDLSKDKVYLNASNILSDRLSVLLNKSIAISENEKSGIKLFLNPLCEVKHKDGYKISSSKSQVIIESTSSTGILYGVFKIIELIHLKQDIRNIKLSNEPKIDLRILNHWDNLDRTVERGYAGFSIWNWHELPENIEKRYEDYALANASIGINGTVLTNVNANALILRDDYIQKVKAMADLFRKYGIKVYLTARFSAPIELGRLKTADPLNVDVQQWWSKKIDEIYKEIPDFGGFCVKANSEGQPGPQDYGRDHADGANMLAKALQPHGGIVMWRAFVYNHDNKEDRTKQAYNEFMPIDGKFLDNVIVQVKNGPLDFQPREPIHPLFGKMTKTPLMLELQITKEYLGQGTHLVGLANMFEEILQTDTHAKGKGSILAKTTDGSLFGHKLTAIAGVSNIGTSLNWTGNLFGQADWYAYGRLAWDPYLSADQIHKDWVELTFNQYSDKVRNVAFSLLKNSYEVCVNYMTPLGLHHIMAEGHHFGPGPWVDSLNRADWTAVYYHKANKDGIGFDRTEEGSNLLGQYHKGFSSQYENVDECPTEFLLWFHRVPWNKKLKTGRTVWEEMVYRYDLGVKDAEIMHRDWNQFSNEIDKELFNSVNNHLTIQVKEAKWWRNACLAYFQHVGELEYPAGVQKPEKSFQYYKSLRFPFSPGIRPRW